MIISLGFSLANAGYYKLVAKAACEKDQAPQEANLLPELVVADPPVRLPNAPKNLRSSRSTENHYDTHNLDEIVRIFPSMETVRILLLWSFPPTR